MFDDRLFVYGTLRRGSGHRMHDVLARGSSLVDHASIRARLFLVGRYPGAVASDDPTAIVIGETYRLSDPDTLFRLLDRYEGYDSSDASALFQRRFARVTLASRARTAAWVYLYNGDTRSLPRIPSGDYLQYHMSIRQ